MQLSGARQGAAPALRRRGGRSRAADRRRYSALRVSADFQVRPYTLRKGDTLALIAQKRGGRERRQRRAGHSRLATGSACTPTPARPPRARARFAGVDYDQLVKLNHDVKPTAAAPGTTILLPAGALSSRDKEILAGGWCGWVVWVGGVGGFVGGAAGLRSGGTRTGGGTRRQQPTRRLARLPTCSHLAGCMRQASAHALIAHTPCARGRGWATSWRPAASSGERGCCPAPPTPRAHSTPRSPFSHPAPPPSAPLFPYPPPPHT